jgi:hypothetical protein
VIDNHGGEGVEVGPPGLKGWEALLERNQELVFNVGDVEAGWEKIKDSRQ